MAIKLMRIFRGGYTPKIDLMLAKGYRIMPLMKPFILVSKVNQGFGQINGITTESHTSGTKLFPNAQICVFKKSTRELLWETKSKANGDYHVRNIAVGLECFVVAFDPTREYNAVIEDAVVAK
ncbi:carboxypeptidase regulatory-like domain-containing protein [Acinetobacter sp. YH12025]|uniref:carboxypeptidase regulatory-like domain-containing protein n=1 Tax=Acinetobacter sp. YH12025 TaxID=2601042 RepID=UPI0015D42570|nr:carboxypeptidase regulatory-like domain-containing protein [Acinetobacter sp. YH12025]